MRILIYALALLLLLESGASAAKLKYLTLKTLFYQQNIKKITELANKIKPNDIDKKDRDLAALLIANAYRLRYDWQNAANWYKAAMIEHRKNWVWAAAYYAFSLKRMGFYKEAADILSKLPETKSSYLNARIHYHLGVCFEYLKDSRAIYEFLRAASIDKILKPLAYQRIASIYLKEKRYKDAYIIAIELLNKNKYDKLAKKIFLKVYPLIKKHSPQTRFIYARLLFINRRYQDALQVFGTIMGAKGLYWQARALSGMKKYYKALNLYRKLLKRYSTSSFSYYTLKRMFRIYYYATKKYHLGAKTISKLLRKLPVREKPYANYILYLLYKKINKRFANYWGNRLIKRYPESKYAKGLAREFGLNAYFNGNYKKAIKYFKVAAYYYWIALCYKKLKNKKLYQKYLNIQVRTNSTNYYATLLEKRLPFTKLKSRYRRLLYWEEKAGFVEAACNIYKQMLIAPRNKLQTYYKISLLSALFREYRQSMGFAYIYILKAKRYTPQDVWKLYLPKTIYWKYIKKQAERLHLNPYLILALIKHESSFDPLAISHANAIGLMQLLPQTAKAITKKKVNLFKPKTNIATGSLYLYYKLKRLKRIEWAIASYNAGERVVKRWISVYRAKRKSYSSIEWIESIGYPETRNYVKKVLASYHLYRMLYQKRRYKR